MKKRRFWISALISAVLLALALRNIQPAEVMQALKGAQFQFLLIASLVRVALAVVRAFRWQVLLTPATGHVPLGTLFRTWLIGFFGNYTLPSQSGELLKLYFLGRRERISRSAILGTLLLAAAGWVAALVLLLGLATQRQSAVALVERLLRKVLPRFAAWGVARFDLFVEGLSALRSLRTFVLSLGLSFVVWGVQLVPFALVGRAVGLDIPIYGYLLLMVVFNLASLIREPWSSSLLPCWPSSMLTRAWPSPTPYFSG